MLSRTRRRQPGQPQRSTQTPCGFEPLESRLLMSHNAGGDVVLSWNEVALDALRFDRSYAGPVRAGRNMAIVQAAVYDAVNGVERTHEPFFVFRTAPAGADVDAAASSAAARALTKLYPKQKRFFAGELRSALADIPDGRAERSGVKYGRYVADRIVAWRRRDGSAGDAFYEAGNRPGDWQPTPPQFLETPLHAGAGDMTAFALSNVDDFVPPPPPRLDSAEYAVAYNEVYDFGDRLSPFRTADQTEIGIFWAYDRRSLGTPVALYNQVLQTVATDQGNTMSENARLFATANVAMADAGIVAWECKYVDNFWRPVTGIHDGDLDGNPDTLADPNWEPLGAPNDDGGEPFTPPFPAYVSGHSTFGAALFRSLSNFYGTDAVSFQLTSDELPGVVRSYTSFSQAATENGDSRIYLGVHWRFDDTFGQAAGRQVADAVFAEYFTPTA
jgi:hypothetical protein